MGVFPRGRDHPEPVQQDPGFSVRDVHFVPGFPVMAHPMIEWLLDTAMRTCTARNARELR
jgi:molybdopterin-biosynthesis enzyme MoeA-like protein